jgi:sarcosine oxidase, subunit alpha
VFGEKVVVALQELGWGEDGPRRCLWRIRAKTLIVATGGIEQPMVFDHNDRPGVMLSGAISEYLERHAVRAGRRAVLVTNNDAAYQQLARWRAAGIEIAAIVDSRASPGPTAAASVKESGSRLIAAPRTLTVTGRFAVNGLRVVDALGERKSIACDLIAMAGGSVPSVHLYSQAQGTLEYRSDLHAYAPATGAPGLYATGTAAGLHGLESIAQHARSVGQAASVFALTGTVRAVRPDVVEVSPVAPMGPTRFEGRALRQWLDFQHDVTVADAASAVAQGYSQVEHFKRYTTTGMAVDQGKTSLRNALDELSKRTGQSLRDLRPPTYRPPFVPLPLAAAAGPNTGRWSRPERRLPCHAEHQDLHAVLDDVGGWTRPLHSGGHGSASVCISEEVRAVRSSVGVFEGSPLGKLSVSGPDALEFLDRLYVNNLRTLGPGRVRYVLMLREDGTVMDDGTVTCVEPNEYLVTTTTGNAERVALWMREWAECEWPQLRVIVTPITTAWGTVTLSGPKAREILSHIVSGVDLGKDAFPHMTYREGIIDGGAARIHRVSFTGEVSYEVNVPAHRTIALWRACMGFGSPAGLRPYGIDSLNVMRTEKGYLHIGADTDSKTTPLDLGWRTLIEKKSADFVGRGALALAEYQRADRQQLVGVQSVDPAAPLMSGAHLINASGAPSEGFLTSACFSPTLGDWVALARLKRGQARLGEQLLAFDQGQVTSVRIVNPVFYDPDNSRLQA